MASYGSVNGILGFGWPWTANTGSIPPPLKDAEVIQANLFRLYSTEPGDDKTEPLFGLALLSFVFATTGQVLDDLIRSEVIRVTGLWEPRVRVSGVTVEDYEDQNTGIRIVEPTVEYEFQGEPGEVSFTRTGGGNT